MLRVVPLASFVACFACAASALTALSARAQELEIQIEPLFGPAATVEQWTLDESGTITADEQSVHWTDLRSIRWSREVADPKLAPFEVHLIGSGKVMADRIVLVDEAIQLELSGERLELPIEWVAGVVNREVSSDGQLAAATLDEDRLIVKLEEGEQAVDGLLESMTVDGVEFSFESNVREIDWSRIASLALATAGLEEAKQGARVRLDNGWVWFGEPKSFDGERLSLMIGQTPIEIDATQILSIEILSDRVLQLSDQEPLEVEERGLLLPARSYRRNVSVLGSPLRVLIAEEGSSGSYRTFERGLGVPSGTTIVFETLDYDRFATLIGLDETSDGRADCEVVIELDGSVAFRQRLSGRDAAMPVDLDLQGARQLTIRIEFGSGLELGDHVDFCDARLVRSTRQ